MPNYQSLAYFIPEIILLTAVIGLLLIITCSKLSVRIEHLIIGAGLVASLLALIFFQPSESHGIFNNLLVWDSYAKFIQICILLMAGAMLVIFRQDRLSHSSSSIEFGVLFLILIFAGLVIAGANHLIAIFIVLQLISITSFLITQIGNTDQTARMAAWHDLIFNIIANLVMSMGIALFYSLTGTFFIAEIGQIFSNSVRLGFPIIIAIVMILFGFTHTVTGIFRLSWKLEIYRTISAPNRLLLLTIPQFAETAVLIRLINIGFSTITDIRPIFLILGIFTVITVSYPIFWLAKVRSIPDTLNITSMVQTGFGLLAISALSMSGNVAALFHQIVFIFSLMAITTGELITRFNEERSRPDQIIFLASLIGIPLTAGFPAKYLVLSSLVKPDPWYYFLIAVGIGSAALIFIGYGRLIWKNGLDLQRSFRFPARGERLISAFRALILLAVICGGIFWTPLTNQIQSIMTFYIP